MALTASLTSCTIPLDKLAVAQASPPFHGLFLTSGIALGRSPCRWRRGVWRRPGGIRGMGAVPPCARHQHPGAGVPARGPEVLPGGRHRDGQAGIGNLMAVFLGRR